MTNFTDSTIKAYEEAGFNRWTKGNHDRLYINAEQLGLEVTRYKSGNVKSATWQGERISNADANRLMASKVYIDIKTGELHVTTNFNDYENPLEDVAQAFVDGIKVEDETEEEPTETIYQIETAHHLIHQVGERYEDDADYDDVTSDEEFDNLDDAVAHLAEMTSQLARPKAIRTSHGLDHVEYDALELVRLTLDEDGDVDDIETIDVRTSLTDDDRKRINAHERAYWAFLDYKADSYGELMLAAE